jgi:hypothetical protein
VVVVEDLDDLGLLDARDALGLLGVVDEQDRRGSGSASSAWVMSPMGAAGPSTAIAAR